jgi:hypothetical protein
MVPLFSGFMYAAVGSYIARIQRIFDIRVRHYPPLWTTWVLAAAIYVNFFAHHWLPDIRLGLFVLTAVLFGRGWFYFTPDRARPVEGDHRIFHPADRAVDRLGRRIGIGEGELVVDVDGVGDRPRRIGVPQRPGLFRIEGHGHDHGVFGALLVDAHGIPDEFAA